MDSNAIAEIRGDIVITRFAPPRALLSRRLSIEVIDLIKPILHRTMQQNTTRWHTNLKREAALGYVQYLVAGHRHPFVYHTEYVTTGDTNTVACDYTVGWLCDDDIEVIDSCVALALQTVAFRQLRRHLASLA